MEVNQILKLLDRLKKTLRFYTAVGKNINQLNLSAANRTLDESVDAIRSYIAQIGPDIPKDQGGVWEHRLNQISEFIIDDQDSSKDQSENLQQIIVNENILLNLILRNTGEDLRCNQNDLDSTLQHINQLEEVLSSCLE